MSPRSTAVDFAVVFVQVHKQFSQIFKASFLLTSYYLHIVIFQKPKSVNFPVLFSDLARKERSQWLTAYPYSNKWIRLIQFSFSQTWTKQQCIVLSYPSLFLPHMVPLNTTEFLGAKRERMARRNGPAKLA